MNIWNWLTQSNRTPAPRRARPRLSLLESLEYRSLMATLSPMADAPAEVSSQASKEESLLSITSATLLVNGRAVTVQDGGLVELNIGENLQVGDVQFLGGNQLGTTGGVIALEGYLQKFSPANPDGVIDYGDGRFGSGVACSDVALHQSHPGLTGNWKMQAGWNQLSLAAVHYLGDGSTVVGRLNVRLQVGRPEFQTQLEDWNPGSTRTIIVGQEFHFRGNWSNAGQGTFRNDAEIDVFRADASKQPVWVGMLSGAASTTTRVQGEFLNDNPNDPFAQIFKPVTAGTYIVRVTVDPEATWNDSNRANNVVEYRLNVIAPVSAGNKTTEVFATASLPSSTPPVANQESNKPRAIRDVGPTNANQVQNTPLVPLVIVVQPTPAKKLGKK